MSNYIQTPNMLLNLPVPTVDPGPDWAAALNAALAFIDGHTHAIGSGVQVQPAGLNINSALTFQNNAAINLLTSQFQPQTAPLSAATYPAGLYVAMTSGGGNELYYNDSAGNQVPLTLNGNVVSGVTQIVSGNDTASFVSNVLTVASSSTGPLNISGASLLLGNAGNLSSKFATLQAPASLGANYSITVPPTNSTGSPQLVSMSTGNVMGFVAPDGVTIGLSGTTLQVIVAGLTGLTTANLSATAGITLPQLAIKTASSSTAAVGECAISSSCGLFDTESESFVNVTNLSITITTNGNPVMLMLIPDGTTGSTNQGSFLGATSFSGGSPINGLAQFQFVRGATSLGYQALTQATNTTNAMTVQVPPGTVNQVDVVTAGTYTYTFQARTPNGEFAYVEYCKIFAYEL